MIGWKLILALFIASTLPWGTAMAGPRPTTGDEDPFPLVCVDFSGQWRSDAGSRYTIFQKDCSFLKIDMVSGSSSETLTIVPDNRVRVDKGASIRHRWNSTQKGTSIETNRTYIQQGVRVTDVIVFEQATPNLLLQTTYRTLENVDGSGEPQHQYDQQVFRRADSLRPEGSTGKDGNF